MNTDNPRNSGDPLDTLFRAAREQAGDFDHLEYGFETRTLALIRNEREERGASWIAWATRLCPYAAALAIAAGAWTYLHQDDSPDSESVVNAVRLAGVPVLDYYLGGDQ